jgi:hypothetical protein
MEMHLRVLLLQPLLVLLLQLLLHLGLWLLRRSELMHRVLHLLHLLLVIWLCHAFSLDYGSAYTSRPVELLQGVDWW